MANKQMFLYWGSGSAPCWKPMIVLEEKGLWEGCPNKRLDFSKNEHKQDDVLALNVRGQLPTFKDDKIVVNESGAICMYLEDRYSNDSNRLIPAAMDERAKVYQRMFESANIISNIMDPLIRYIYRTKKEDWKADHLEEATKKTNDELDHWNQLLGEQNYLCGDHFTMADVFFYPYLALIVRYGAKLSGQPELKKYYDRVSARPSILNTWPPHWKDSEGPGFLNDLLS